MKLDTFTTAYLEAIEFTEVHADNPELLGNQFSPELVSKAVADCAKFQAENDLSGYPLERAGHDFWYTRNRHGVGFWENDFGTEEQCKLLTDASHKFGEIYTHVIGDKIHFV